MKNCMLILDFGSQYTHLIKLRLDESNIRSVIKPGDITIDEVYKKYGEQNIGGIILSGGAYSVQENKILFDTEWLTQGLPILGICYGHQLLASYLGGKVEQINCEYGKEVVAYDISNILFTGMHGHSVVWMSHADSVVTLPNGFVSIASTKDGINAGIANKNKMIYGVQFHPEVIHTIQGIKILENFALRICGMTKSDSWTPKMFVKESSRTYSKLIGKERVILALSGGVDSATLAVLLRNFLSKEQLIAVYIDSGLEPTNVKSEVFTLCYNFDIQLLQVDASDIFFKSLKGVTDPIKKRIVVGRVFINEFKRITKENNAIFFAQGTIWSDVIESGVTKFSSQIKPHHNVGGLPKKLTFTLIEPLRELFKNQVRVLAAYLKLPAYIVNKRVFPGPGFALRVDGEVTRERVKIVRKCTEIIEEVMNKSNIIDTKQLMGFAIYIQVKSSGVKGDMQYTNDYAVVVRIVETKDLLTANFSEKAFILLGEISNRIIKETGAGKVLYDITNKPPSTIDWQ